MGAFDSFSTGELEVKLDGMTVEIPPERRSFAAIRSYLESLALQQQRILCALNVDGESVNLTQPRHTAKQFTHIEGETMTLGEVPVQLIKAALQQAGTLCGRVQKCIELVLINEPGQAREIWWSLSTGMKEPLLTLSLLPEGFGNGESGSASMSQLQKWQLQQLGCIIQDVEEASQHEDTTVLSEALEKRALPWIEKLIQSLNLRHEAILSGAQAGCRGS